METIIEKLRRYTEMNPGAAILFDDAHSKGITYAQLDDMSARVCGWLKARKTADAFVLYQRENRWKRSVQHGLLSPCLRMGESKWHRERGLCAH